LPPPARHQLKDEHEGKRSQRARPCHWALEPAASASMCERYQISNDIAGRVAVIVGAAGGMGRAISHRLANAGCLLTLVDLERVALEQLIGELGLGEMAIGVAADIADRGQVGHMAAEVEKRFGQVQILVNAAGVNTRERTLADLSPEQWERVVAVNLSGVFHCVQALIPLLRTNGGIVVNIVSTAAFLASPVAGTHYCAAKRALVSLTESINVEQGRYGIRACALSPGEVDTPMIDRRPQPPDPERRAAMLRPEDVAEAVYYVVTRPPRVTVSELVIFPSAQVSGIYVV